MRIITYGRREKYEKQWSEQWNNDSRVQINESINKQVRDGKDGLDKKCKRFIHKRETDTNNRGGNRRNANRKGKTEERERDREEERNRDIESGSDAGRISSEGSVNRCAVDDLGKTSLHWMMPLYMDYTYMRAATLLRSRVTTLDKMFVCICDTFTLAYLHP